MSDPSSSIYNPPPFLFDPPLPPSDLEQPDPPLSLLIVDDEVTLPKALGQSDHTIKINYKKIDTLKEQKFLKITMWGNPETFYDLSRFDTPVVYVYYGDVRIPSTTKKLFLYCSGKISGDANLVELILNYRSPSYPHEFIAPRMMETIKSVSIQDSYVGGRCFYLKGIAGDLDYLGVGNVDYIKKVGWGNICIVVENEVNVFRAVQTYVHLQSTLNAKTVHLDNAMISFADKTKTIRGTGSYIKKARRWRLRKLVVGDIR